MTKRIKMLLVDDHKLVLDGFKMLLSEHEPFEVIAEARDGAQAIMICKTQEIEVVMMDINLPVMNGIEVTREIKKHKPAIKIIMLSMNDEDDYVIKSDQAGADGYLLKSIEKEELIEAITIVSEGGKYYSKTLSPDLIFNIQNKKYIKEDTGRHQGKRIKTSSIFLNSPNS